MFSGVLGMYSFDQRMASVVNDTNKKGWFVAILELGAWFGVLCTGYLADKFSRKYTIVLGMPVLFLLTPCGEVRILTSRYVRGFRHALHR